MKNNKISFLINSLTSGGAERVLSILLNELNNQGFYVELICLEKNNFYHLNENIKVIYLSGNNGKSNSIFKFLTIPVLAYKLKKHTKKNDIKLIQSHIYRANFVNTLAKLFGAKHKVQIVNAGQISMYKSKGILGKVNLFLIHKLYPYSDLIICKSKGMEIDLQTHFPKTLNTTIINNPYDIKKIESVYNEEITNFNFLKDKIYLLYVGRFASFKKPEYIINSLPYLNKNIELILLGDGPKKNDLKNLSENLKIEDRVHFLGNVSNPYKYMKKSNIFILSSDDGEGFPNVLAEAMICKIPVISTDCKSGPREILSPNSDINIQLKYENEITDKGILVPIGNIEKIVEAIALLISNKNLKNEFLENAYNRAQDFSLESIMLKYKKVLELE
jgi:N-acetylgalactosamine-N,N'-diacetylbacillosaminyl-diphospho-undecaprenol 4-alpha-N-acetylgalactosaminyltransferase